MLFLFDVGRNPWGCDLMVGPGARWATWCAHVFGDKCGPEGGRSLDAVLGGASMFLGGLGGKLKRKKHNVARIVFF